MRARPFRLPACYLTRALRASQAKVMTDAEWLHAAIHDNFGLQPRIENHMTNAGSSGA